MMDVLSDIESYGVVFVHVHFRTVANVYVKNIVYTEVIAGELSGTNEVTDSQHISHDEAEVEESESEKSGSTNRKR